MRYIISLFILSFVFINSIKAQLSQGGFPLEVTTVTKSATRSLIAMPVLQANAIDSIINRDFENGQLKNLRFAYPFKVCYTPSNSGKWYKTNVGYNVWKLNIASKGAKSLNLIFNKFELPENTRLFIYNETENQYLGAFTSSNNKKSKKFAVAPVAGDTITVQYEVPEELGKPSDFEISQINHDFVGILKTYRRPTGETAGACNIDINCEMAERFKELKNACCRIIINGEDICSGTLVNNTNEDETPYIISAWHCYEEWDYAETSIFTFNYESPFCAPLDGDPVNTLSGSIMKAWNDSLDFALVEMDDVPPIEYRPFFAGWDRSNTIPDSSFSIHHPQGDIKKISFDYDSPEYATFTTAAVKNPENASFKILEWDEGVTEAGSSGGALYNPNRQLIGTLSGGAAMCGNPVNDFFERFSLQWDYSSDSSKQLKCWLDPINTGVETLDGKQFNTDENLCVAVTNLDDNDNYENVPISPSDTLQGYWGGTNSAGINEFVERFSVAGEENLDGVALGISKITNNNSSYITINVYNGNNLPESLIYSKDVTLSAFVADAMNYISFDEAVEPNDTFFVGFNIDGVDLSDNFVLYQSLRENTDANNCFYYQQDGSWYNFKESNSNGYALSNVMELIACNYGSSNGSNVIDSFETINLYPNPTNDIITLESDKEIPLETISIYNLLGQTVPFNVTQSDTYQVKIKLHDIAPGIYIIRFNHDEKLISRKFSYIP